MLFTAISILINNNEEIFVLYLRIESRRICIINYCKFSQRGYSAATIWNYASYQGKF